jgi:fatty acid synthase subunit alpha, fungi type
MLFNQILRAGVNLCLAGSVIGRVVFRVCHVSSLTPSTTSWTRGTGLMGASNVVAHELGSYGVHSFCAKEMAFNIIGLMHPLLFSITQVESIWADLNGGMDRLPDLADITTRIRLSLIKRAGFAG